MIHTLRNNQRVLLGLFVICIFLLAMNTLIAPASEKKQHAMQTVKTSPTPTVTVKTTAQVSIVPTYVLRKESFTIALYGDSMIDTMGEKTEPLQEVLSKKYPNATFTLYNYGIGGQNIEQGLARFDAAFAFKTRSYPSIASVKPDIIILGSFAYNIMNPHDPAKHKRLLTELVNKMKTITPNVYLLAEIAPRKTGFGKGEFGINVAEDTAYLIARDITQQLDNVAPVAAETNVPLINAYSLSQIDGKFGEPAYVRPEDGIHPSYTGHIFTSRIITRVIAPSLEK